MSIAYDLSDEAEFVESRVLRVVEQASSRGSGIMGIIGPIASIRSQAYSLFAVLVIRESYYLGSILGVPSFREPTYSRSPQRKYNLSCPNNGFEVY